MLALNAHETVTGFISAPGARALCRAYEEIYRDLLDLE